MNHKFSGRKKILIPLFILAFLALVSFVVMLLWNNILVAVLHISAINFWQALGILILSKILFGGFHGAHWGRHSYMRHKLKERWMNMSPEEKEKFKQDWKNRHGRYFDEGSGTFTEQTEPNK